MRSSLLRDGIPVPGSGGWRVLDVDPATHTVTWHKYDDATNASYIHESQEVDPYLAMNARMRSVRGDGGGGGMTLSDKQSIRSGWHHVARIPNSVVTLWKRLYGVDIFKRSDQQRVFALLNSSEWAKLRTGGGRL